MDKEAFIKQEREADERRREELLSKASKQAEHINIIKKIQAARLKLSAEQERKADAKLEKRYQQALKEEAKLPKRMKIAQVEQQKQALKKRQNAREIEAAKREIEELQRFANRAPVLQRREASGGIVDTFMQITAPQPRPKQDRPPWGSSLLDSLDVSRAEVPRSRKSRRRTVLTPVDMLVNTSNSWRWF